MHEREDEFFLVWKGRFRVEFRDRVVALEPGECVTVPRGVEHRTCADAEAEILCFEPAGVLNTGNVTDEIFTAPKGAGITTGGPRTRVTAAPRRWGAGGHEA